ncbi:hypothetical protein LIER_22513 [Lithospermum erythrorhizon]|uniref:Uncharacterized protein n=1 Tax=Lithospermum erythrorhizon TaxID=34254 RepID=A0AAV3QWP6_LITER
MWISITCFYLACLLAGEGPPTDVATGFTPHLKSTCALPRSTKHKSNKRPTPLHSYSDPRVLKAAGLTPGSHAELGALEALRATYNVYDHALPPPPAAPATSSDQQPLRTMVVSSCSEEDEVTRPLLRRYLHFPGLSSFVDPFVASILTWVARFSSHLPAGKPLVMGPRDAALELRGVRDDTSQASRGYLSSSPVLHFGQGEGSLPPTDPVSALELLLSWPASIRPLWFWSQRIMER